MSKIQQFGRPHETFDPDNQKHRKIFYEVMQYKTWGRSPICFWAEDDSSGSNSLMDQCIKAMGKYYMEKEFGEFSDADPFAFNETVRMRPNPYPYPYVYTRKSTIA